MSEMIHVLQLGTENWKDCYQIPDNLAWTYQEKFLQASRVVYDIVFVDRELLKEETELLYSATKTYTLFVTEGIEPDKEMREYFHRKRAKWLKKEDIQRFLSIEARNYYPTPYGEKFHLRNLAVAQGFSGTVLWNGNYSMTLCGDFGEALNQAVYWRNNIPVYEGQAIDFWLEYKKAPGVEIALKITQFFSGSVSGVQKQWIFSEEELENIVTIDSGKSGGPVFVSLLAKGSGKLEVISLHNRHSRRGHGTFIPGGQRHVTSDREEIFYYFDPGDLKPPLNVYFSGYKTMEGFEGYYMMRKMGTPFLLIAEPRLEGGCFYMGAAEYEEAVAGIIRRYMKELGFSGDQVIMSGLSMGTYGALYYSCDIIPHAVILGKPVTNTGDVAANERLHRPGGFPASLDVLNYLTGGLEEKHIGILNKRFWDKFDRTDWGDTKFVLSYMLEDDYDNRAYDMLLSHLQTGGELYGKGLHGRHNDATNAIVEWFKSQYADILAMDFHRKD